MNLSEDNMPVKWIEKDTSKKNHISVKQSCRRGVKPLRIALIIRMITASVSSVQCTPNDVVLVGTLSFIPDNMSTILYSRGLDRIHSHLIRELSILEGP